MKRNLASATDPLGRVAHYNYDSLGHLQSLTPPLPAEIAVESRFGQFERKKPNSMTTSREIALDLLRHLLSGERDDINSTGSTPNSYLYRGEQFDLDLGLYYLRARYYNPALDGS